jgi:hypothetical protein
MGFYRNVDALYCLFTHYKLGNLYTPFCGAVLQGTAQNKRKRSITQSIITDLVLEEIKNVIGVNVKMLENEMQKKVNETCSSLVECPPTLPSYLSSLYSHIKEIELYKKIAYSATCRELLSFKQISQCRMKENIRVYLNLVTQFMPEPVTEFKHTFTALIQDLWEPGMHKPTLLPTSIIAMDKPSGSLYGYYTIKVQPKSRVDSPSFLSYGAAHPIISQNTAIARDEEMQRVVNVHEGIFTLKQEYGSASDFLTNRIQNLAECSFDTAVVPCYGNPIFTRDVRNAAYTQPITITFDHAEFGKVSVLLPELSDHTSETETHANYGLMATMALLTKSEAGLFLCGKNAVWKSPNISPKAEAKNLGVHNNNEVMNAKKLLKAKAIIKDLKIPEEFQNERQNKKAQKILDYSLEVMRDYMEHEMAVEKERREAFAKGKEFKKEKEVDVLDYVDAAYTSLESLACLVDINGTEVSKYIWAKWIHMQYMFLVMKHVPVAHTLKFIPQNFNQHLHEKDDYTEYIDVLTPSKDNCNMLVKMLQLHKAEDSFRSWLNRMWHSNMHGPIYEHANNLTLYIIACCKKMPGFYIKSLRALVTGLPYITADDENGRMTSDFFLQWADRYKAAWMEREQLLDSLYKGVERSKYKQLTTYNALVTNIRIYKLLCTTYYGMYEFFETIEKDDIVATGVAVCIRFLTCTLIEKYKEKVKPDTKTLKEVFEQLSQSGRHNKVTQWSLAIDEVVNRVQLTRSDLKSKRFNIDAMIAQDLTMIDISIFKPYLAIKTNAVYKFDVDEVTAYLSAAEDSKVLEYVRKGEKKDFDIDEVKVTSMTNRLAKKIKGHRTRMRSNVKEEVKDTRGVKFKGGTRISKEKDVDSESVNINKNEHEFTEQTEDEAYTESKEKRGFEFEYNSEILNKFMNEKRILFEKSVKEHGEEVFEKASKETVQDVEAKEYHEEDDLFANLTPTTGKLFGSAAAEEQAEKDFGED